MAKTNLFTASLLPLLLIACAGSPESTEADPTAKPPARPSTDDPKAPPVEGKPQASDLVESLGVFVTPSGSATPEGTRARPFASIQQGIDAGKKAGKRVYVCAGSYSEALVLADSISVIGGLDCSKPEWTIGAPNARSKVVAPTSPAITARAITTATRISGLDVLSPDATDPGASSIALLAEKSPALRIATSELASGDGAKGADGADPSFLVQGGQVDGTAAIDWAVCRPGSCSPKPVGSGWEKFGPVPGGTSLCGGAPDQNGEAGGSGGSGGLWRSEMGVFGTRWVPYDAASSSDNGDARTGAVGIAGDNGPNGSVVGSLGPDGYVTADGTAGTDGKPGSGGSGGAGSAPPAPRETEPSGTIARGASGAGGGAGGCPGLAGKLGQGGGASIAVALVDSPIVIEDSRMTSRTGGAAGLGSFGARPSRGGAPASGFTPSGNSGAGGNGGLAGTSGNGGAGPSFGVAHVGGAPTMKGTSAASAGSGGQGVAARTRTMGVGGDVTIAATPQGLSEPMHAF